MILGWDSRIEDALNAALKKIAPSAERLPMKNVDVERILREPERVVMRVNASA